VADDDGSELGVPLLQRIVRHRYTAGQLLVLDVFAAVLLLVLAVYGGPHKVPRLAGAGWRSLSHVVDAVTLVAVLFRRTYPQATLLLLLPICLAVLSLRADGPELFYLGMALYSVVVVSSRRAGGWIAGGVIAASVVCVVIGGGSLVASSVLGLAATLLLGWLAAENTRSGRLYAVQRAEREAERAAAADGLQADRIQQAIDGERVKIARELHDVVAHAMSVVAVRAGVARMVIDVQPEQAREALSIIETTTRRALHEMRLLVGMLRDHNEAGSELGPAPGVENLGRLIDEIELAGVAVDVQVTGERRPLPPAADLSTYRIIQEALTNVVRHAGPTSAHVRINFRTEEVDIAVTDDGPAPGSARRPNLAATGTGHGIIGMRERTALFGGILRAEHVGHGFRVEASLRTDG
jgi:signal transduction histidine kinase